DGWRAGHRIRVLQAATEHGRYPGGPKCAGGHLGAPDGYGWGTANDQTADARTVSAQLLDRLQRAPPLEEVMRNPQFGLVGQRVSGLHQDEAVTLGPWDCRRKAVSPDLGPAAADARG